MADKMKNRQDSQKRRPYVKATVKTEPTLERQVLGSPKLFVGKGC